MSQIPDTSQAAEESFPEVGAVADLILASQPDPYLCWVEQADTDRLVVSGPVDGQLRPIAAPIGERVDLVWRGPSGLRCLPAELLEVEPGERPRWRLTPAGVVQRGQRRDAVRAPMTAPVTVGSEPEAVRGTAVDVSEGGVRCVLERQPGPGTMVDMAPTVGDVIRVAVELPELTIRCLAEVTRRFPRDDDRIELSLRFIGLSEQQQDGIRQQVFARLRRLRQRGLL
jgi:hypothetical protein